MQASRAVECKRDFRRDFASKRNGIFETEIELFRRQFVFSSRAEHRFGPGAHLASLASRDAETSPGGLLLAVLFVGQRNKML
jgi:hypothetical protein